MITLRLAFLFITVIFGSFFVTIKSDGGEPDTSLYDFVAYSVLEDFVDIVEVTAWITRKVKDNIDKLLEDAFLILTKQQTILNSVISLAETQNRKDCSDGRYMNVTDVVFREYFNLNLNCPLIGQKMSLFFNEIHNLTARVADIHRKYINGAVNCGPPVYPKADRTCLQNLVESCRKETKVIRNFVSAFQYDIDAFMDGQEEETFQCLINGMSEVRSAAIKAVNDIYCCLNIKDYDVNKKYKSNFVRKSMGLVGNKFVDILKKLETIGLPVENNDVKTEMKFEMPKQPYYEPAKSIPKHFVPRKNPQEHLQKPQLQHESNLNQPHIKVSQQSQEQEPHPGEQPTNEPNQTTPPWKIDPSKSPKYANKKDNSQDETLDFDPSIFDELDNSFSSHDHTEVRDEL